MRTPTTGRGRGNGGRREPPPPPVPEYDPNELPDFDEIAAMPTLAIIEAVLQIMRHPSNDPDANDMARIFRHIEALHHKLTTTDDPSLLTPIEKLNKDLKQASRHLGKDEARFLVDAYYKMQEDRIRSSHQVRTLAASSEEHPEEPHEVIEWLLQQETELEKQIRTALDYYSASDVAGVWARSVKGIAPVIAAGLLANIDITRAPTVGHIWRFAGLDPTVRWNKGQKRPWNASLKRLCFLIGESFVKVSNRPDDIYGKIYKARKDWETERNRMGVYAEQARISLETKKFDPSTDAFKHYTAGRLPPARIHLRASRRAVKLFLAHLHEVLYWAQYETLPPHPWVLEHVPGHVHRIEVPNLDLMDGLREAKERAQRGPRPRRT